MSERGRFLDWLAGFIDGEGCFLISIPKAGRWTQFSFALDLRDDDHEIIEEIHRQLGFGRVRRRPGRRSGRTKANPGIYWRCDNLGDCRKLVTALEGRLRSKKKLDFEIWATALRAKDRGAGEQTLRAYKVALEAIRRYSPSDEEREPIMMPDFRQARMIE